MRLSFTELSRRDLKQIFEFVAPGNPAAADELLRGILQTCELLTTQPEAGSTAEFLGPGLRKFRHRKYLIFYRIREGEIRIIRVIHGARDLRRQL